MRRDDLIWADELAAQLEREIHSLEFEYRRLERLAARRSGEDLRETRERMVRVTERIMNRRSRIRSLRFREKH